MPQDKWISLQPGYVRDLSGTDIYIAAYKDEFMNSWKTVILKEVIDRGPGYRFVACPCNK